MISVAASLVLLSSGYAALLRRGVAWRGIGLTLLAVFVAGNAVNTGNLLRFGRGQYLAALRFIQRNSDNREIAITSDHDFRNGMLVNHYKRYLVRPDHVHYVDRATLDEENVRTKGASLGAEWLILHRFDLTEQSARVTDEYGNRYELVNIYRYSDLSGWNWLLYHNLNRPPVVPPSPAVALELDEASGCSRHGCLTVVVAARVSRANGISVCSSSAALPLVQHCLRPGLTQFELSLHSLDF
jgi:hypothetical protein